jgi:hypothetical protein
MVAARLSSQKPELEDTRVVAVKTQPQEMRGTPFSPVEIHGTSILAELYGWSPDRTGVPESEDVSDEGET